MPRLENEVCRRSHCECRFSTLLNFICRSASDNGCIFLLCSNNSNGTSNSHHHRNRYSTPTTTSTNSAVGPQQPPFEVNYGAPDREVKEEPREGSNGNNSTSAHHSSEQGLYYLIMFEFDVTHHECRPILTPLAFYFHIL